MSATLQAIGGVSPYTWAVISGSLPAGLSLNGSTGVISGTPTTAGPSTFTVRVTDANSATATQILTITINAAYVSLASGSSTAPSSGSSGALTQAQEHATAFIVDAAAGGVPTWSGGYASGVLANIQTNALTRLSAAQQVVNATTALTASGTITSAPWAA